MRRGLFEGPASTGRVVPAQRLVAVQRAPVQPDGARGAEPRRCGVRGQMRHGTRAGVCCGSR
eukprot:10935568-Alexandrium_andersonii.AAC.1